MQLNRSCCLTCTPGCVVAQFNWHSNCATATTDTVIVVLGKCCKCFTTSDIKCNRSIVYHILWTIPWTSDQYQGIWHARMTSICLSINPSTAPDTITAELELQRLSEREHSHSEVRDRTSTPSLLAFCLLPDPLVTDWDPNVVSPVPVHPLGDEARLSSGFVIPSP